MCLFGCTGVWDPLPPLWRFENMIDANHPLRSVDPVSYAKDARAFVLMFSYAWREEWRQEIAREEGMLGGCGAYNDWMGY